MKKEEQRTCGSCGKDITNRHGLARYCSDDCYKNNKRNLDKKYNKKRKNRPYYHSNYNKFKRKGSGNVGPHLFKINGKANFKKEARIIRCEKTKMLRLGFTQFNPIINRNYKEECFQDMRNNLSDNQDDFVSDKSIEYHEYFFCPICKEGIIVKPIIPRTWEYNYDGVPIQFCINCFTVVNWEIQN